MISSQVDSSVSVAPTRVTDVRLTSRVFIDRVRDIVRPLPGWQGIEWGTTSVSAQTLNQTEADIYDIPVFSGGVAVIDLYGRLIDGTPAGRDQDHLPVVLIYNPAADEPDGQAQRPTVAIVGGQGPKATLFFLKKLADRKVPFVCFSNPLLLDRTAAIMTDNADNQRTIGTMLFLTAQKLRDDYHDLRVCFPCNTLHYWVAKAGPSVINMVRETVDYLRTLDHTRPTLLLSTPGTVKARVFDALFDQAGLAYTVPDSTDRERIMAAITAIKENRPPDTQAVIEVLKNSGGAGQVVLGCTELPILFQRPEMKAYVLKHGLYLVDPMDLLIAAVQHGELNPVET